MDEATRKAKEAADKIRDERAAAEQAEADRRKGRNGRGDANDRAR